ncbi:PREDICTED: arylacetamide deacetylase [Chinchilla lanigera]|uniref:arylacetamide deacetylase n=1 Tax=Chinchilla lanigera TaxID=34839 RepID=UPI0006986820|nr:PREDICTED: arylacetamide deacetylase [Chinchilla lanigera]
MQLYIYRLTPKYHFPVQFEDVYNDLRWFLSKNVLEKYGVSPERVCVSGNSAGGNLAAAATQQLFDDPDIKIKPKIQAFIYNALQSLDLDSPSYRENSHMAVLSKSLMVRFWSEYFTTDRALEKAMLSNQHVPAESSHLFKFVNWSSLLPERCRKGHVHTNPTYGSSELFQKYPGFLDVRAAPLLADDNRLRGLPLTYVLTCQYDVLRDDGLMYVTRLQNAGVQVTHNHVEDRFHGALSLLDLKIYQRLIDQYINWLKENL